MDKFRRVSERIQTSLTDEGLRPAKSRIEDNVDQDQKQQTGTPNGGNHSFSNAGTQCRHQNTLCAMRLISILKEPYPMIRGKIVKSREEFVRNEIAARPRPRSDRFDIDQRNACKVDTDNVTVLWERAIASHA